jgi:protein-tyrosine phosphatase
VIEFTQITPDLFVGTCPRTAIDLNQISSMGATGIVSLQTDDDFRKWDVDFPTLEKSSYEINLPIARHPITDFDDDDLEARLLSAVDTVYRMIAVGHRIYLHCTAGQERAPSVAAAYLCKHKNMTVEQAVTKLKSERECSPKKAVIKAVLDA